MNIIIEGPDGAGKTYLAQQLSELLNMSIRHFTAPIDTSSQYDMYKSIGIDIYGAIFDRAWYSDMVYGPIFRGQAEITVSMMYDLERLYDDTIIVYCTGDKKLMWQNALDRGEHYVESYEQYEKICNAYDNLFLYRYHEMPIHVRRATWLEK